MEAYTPYMSESEDDLPLSNFAKRQKLDTSNKKTKTGQKKEKVKY